MKILTSVQLSSLPQISTSTASILSIHHAIFALIPMKTHGFKLNWHKEQPFLMVSDSRDVKTSWKATNWFAQTIRVSQNHHGQPWSKLTRKQKMNMKFLTSMNSHNQVRQLDLWDSFKQAKTGIMNCFYNFTILICLEPTSNHFTYQVMDLIKTKQNKKKML